MDERQLASRLSDAICAEVREMAYYQPLQVGYVGSIGQNTASWAG